MTTPSAVTSAAIPASRGLHIGLWVAQVLLGAAFIMAGSSKAFPPAETVAAQFPFGVGLVRFIGISEILGGLGLILPAATRIVPVLTSAAAVGLTVVMVLAAGFHLTRGEFSAVPVNVVLGGLAVFIAWGRFKKAPIAPRS